MPYADDLSILSPTVASLESMWKVCGLYGKEYDVQFNPNKTKCMEVTKRKKYFKNEIPCFMWERYRVD